MPKKINLKINFLRFVGEMVSEIRNACMIYRSSSDILEIAELYYLSTVDPPFGLISRCFISKSSFSIWSRCAHHRLVPSIFPTEKIPISRRYDNLASASFPPVWPRCNAAVIVPRKVFLSSALLRKTHKFRVASSSPKSCLFK